MSRVIVGLVALSLVPTLISVRTTQTQTFVIQDPDGSVGVGAIQGGIVGGIVPGVPGQAPARDLPPARKGTSRIRGRVLLADTGQPARRATIRVSGGDLREPRSTVTDAEGRYEIGDLPSGRYSLSASKSTYVTINYGQTRPMEPGRPLEIGDNQIVEKVDFSLPRGGVITGRVVDEYGEPVANAMVQPMQNRFLNGQQRPMVSGSPFTTSDTGEYRLWGLSPGQYFVSVNSRSMGGFTMDNSDDRSGYAPTYYPSTANVAEAQSVTLSVGQTASGVDIVLVLTRTSRVSGTAIDSKGQPVRMGMVMAMQRSSSGMMSPQGGQIRPDGTFAISGLPPGEYTLRGNFPPARPGDTPETLVANVTVAGVDISGIVLTPTPPIKITGRITFDPASDWLQPSMVRVMVSPKEPGGMFIGPVAMPIVHDDFTFEAPATPGTMMIRAMPAQLGPGPLAWSVKSIRVDDVEVIDSGVELVAGRDMSGVEIVVTSRVQVVSGLVTNDRGQIAQDATVLFFAQNPELRTTGRFGGQSRPDQNGRYTVRNLPAGDYFAVATDYVDPNRRGSDPNYLEDLSRRATRLTIWEGETRTLDLKVIVQ
jgi:hypothetical protein